MVKIFKFSCLVVILALAAVLFAVLESTRVRIEHVNIACRNIKANTHGVTILQLSDLHLSRFGAYEKRVLRLVNAQHADVVVITGDFLKRKELLENPHSAECRRALAAVEVFVGAIKAPLGVYACRGNNDFSNDKESSDLLLQVLQRAGVQTLINQKVTFQADGGDIYLLGVDFPWFSRAEIADFAVVEADGGRVLQAKSSERNSYSHLLIGDDRYAWQNYGYSGRFRQSQPERGGIGFTFYSQFDRGYDRFYRLRIRAGEDVFHFSNHGAYESPDSVRIEQRLTADQWYCFRIECVNDAAVRRLRARVWPESAAEPETWQAQGVDSTASLNGGTVGLWSAGEGLHQFDDLVVYSLNGDTLLHQDFEAVPIHQDPLGWVDYNYEREAIPWLMQQIPDSAVAILLAHSPDLIQWSAPAGVDIQLSGHTHGGQIRLPFWGPVIYHLDIGRMYAQGLFQWDGTRLYVNRGIGTVMLPLRLFCPPEITLLELHTLNP